MPNLAPGEVRGLLYTVWCCAISVLLCVAHPVSKSARDTTWKTCVLIDVEQCISLAPDSKRSESPHAGKYGAFAFPALEPRRILAAESTCLFSALVPNRGPCWRPARGAGQLVASVAQLVEQLTLNQLVLGSSPSRGTNPKRSPMNPPRRIQISLEKVMGFRP